MVLKDLFSKERLTLVLRCFSEPGSFQKLSSRHPNSLASFENLDNKVPRTILSAVQIITVRDEQQMMSISSAFMPSKSCSLDIIDFFQAQKQEHTLVLVTLFGVAVFCLQSLLQAAPHSSGVSWRSSTLIHFCLFINQFQILVCRTLTRAAKWNQAMGLRTWLLSNSTYRKTIWGVEGEHCFLSWASQEVPAQGGAVPAVLSLGIHPLGVWTKGVSKYPLTPIPTVPVFKKGWACHYQNLTAGGFALQRHACYLVR